MPIRDRSLSVSATSASSLGAGSDHGNGKVTVNTSFHAQLHHLSDNHSDGGDNMSMLSAATSTRHQQLFGWLYIFTMFVGGAYSLAMGESIDTLAEQCGSTATDASLAFVGLGVGAFFGAVSSAFLYQRYFGLNIVFTALLVTSFLLLFLAFNTSLYLLITAYFIIGYLDGIIETGMFIVLRKVLSDKAGVWLGFGQIGNAMGFTFAVFLEGFVDSEYTIFGTVSIFTLSIAIVLLLSTNDDKMLQIVKDNISRGDLVMSHHPHYYVEILIALTVMLIYGGETLVTSYLTTYVESEGVETSDTAKYQLVAMWGVAFFSRILGILDQAYQITNNNILWHTYIFLAFGIVSILPIVINTESSTVLWVGLSCYGFAFGPLIGYVYDWLNRSTAVSETSTAIVVFGMNVGTSLVLYVTTEIWSLADNAVVMFYVVLISVILPIPFLHWSRLLSYIPEVNSEAVYSYLSLDLEEDLDEEVRF
jgi:MFS family permease